MSQSAREVLAEASADVDFLVWLEGAEDFLPRYSRLRTLSLKTYADAICAASWLLSLAHSSEIVHSEETNEWIERYRLLQQFIYGSLRFAYNRDQITAELVSLKDILRELLPTTAWESYIEDIQRIQRSGYAIQLPKTKMKRRGGTGQSEQTNRMRAAIEYTTQYTTKPYHLLTELWNDISTANDYDANNIQKRVNKNIVGAPSFEQALEFWKRIYYEGDCRDVWPGPFPPSKKLQDVWKRINSKRVTA